MRLCYVHITEGKFIPWVLKTEEILTGKQQ